VYFAATKYTEYLSIARHKILIKQGIFCNNPIFFI